MSEKIIEMELDKLIPYARNPRKNDHAVDKIASAIREFGFKVPVIAKSDGTIVDGHLRLKAAQKLGMEAVPVLIADDLTDAQVKAFRLSVNKMAELAEWDEELLRVEFAELTDLGFDLALTGFEVVDLQNIFLESEKIEPEKDSSAKEIDVDSYEMSCICPKCGFEFDDK